ncbi:hypothetical protein [Mycobacterium sp. D16R24]|uniref:hypothetical protein n=1 Tax=Mycobacterium sp. D16R24 TaxID=1855656 RepID=UPI00159207A6|nr:hypothetical protein [Mycobacterium sp. D16R24]
MATPAELASKYDEMLGQIQMDRMNLPEWNLQRFDDTYNQVIFQLQNLIDELQVPL